MRKKCRTCHTIYEVADDEGWKKQCYDCYINFRGKPPIWNAGGRVGVVILSHPDITKEEVDKWIEKTYGSVNCPENWGASEITGKAKVWWNNQNYD